MSTDDLDDVVGYIAQLRSGGHQVVIVHGGGPEITRLHHRLNVKTEKRNGIRITKREGISIAQMVLCGLVNKRLVAHCIAKNVPALGLSGIDAGLLRASLLDEEV